MGEAKLRGSFEERKAMAAERERKARKERAKRDALRPRGKSRFPHCLPLHLLSGQAHFPKQEIGVSPWTS